MEAGNWYLLCERKAGRRVPILHPTSRLGQRKARIQGLEATVLVEPAGIQDAQARSAPPPIPTGARTKRAMNPDEIEPSPVHQFISKPKTGHLPEKRGERQTGL